ncbi:MAG: lipase family protein [Pirellulaceae bacterium]|nr:lipase family protein [Pirellulaceae bacterium]
MGINKVLNSTPGQIDVSDDERGGDWIPPIIDESKLASLQLPWDSEETADWPAADVLSEVSKLAYLPFVEAYPAFRSLGFDEVIPFNSATMFGYVVVDDDVAVIAFRGSESEFGDWWTNASRTPMTIEGGQVHSGFWSSYVAMKPQILRALEKGKPKHVWTCGHSLGGALAVCCAFDFDQTGRALDGVMTFGQPMVARQPLADRIDDKLLGRYARFVNRNDMVARIPPSYRPCGRLVWFTDEGLKRSKRKRALVGASGDSVFSTDTETDEITPLTEAEYQRLVAEKSEPQVKRNADGEIVVEGKSRHLSNGWATLQRCRSWEPSWVSLRPAPTI